MVPTLHPMGLTLIPEYLVTLGPQAAVSIHLKNAFLWLVLGQHPVNLHMEFHCVF